MNERDSEAIAADLLSSNMQLVENEEDADILIYNTCSVREHAERKALGKIGLMKKLKKHKPGLIIGVIGCMAERMRGEILDKLPHVDFVVGTGQLHKIPEIINCEIRKRERILMSGHCDEDSRELLHGFSGHLGSHGRVSAFISAMRGCNRFCSYCIVPYVRGREQSRSMEDVLAEARQLAEKGIKEIVLLGQNIAAYGMDGALKCVTESPFARLLCQLQDIGGISRIRFTSPHPAYFNDRLVEAVVSLPKVCKSIHLPMQSGSDRILKMMNRPYSSSEYLKIVEKLREGAPEICFSTDVIVGFPGEAEEDFNDTRNLMEEVAFDNAYIFKYSPRQGTKSADFADDVPKSIKEERNQILLKDLAERTERRNKSLVGSEFEILVEGRSKRNADRWSGRTGTNKTVVFSPSSEILAGDLVPVKIVRATAMTLYGE